jgi:hypothetical protein
MSGTRRTRLPVMRRAETRALRTVMALLLLPALLRAQSDVLLQGVVYDSTRMRVIPSVRVASTGGRVAYTDTLGQYRILVASMDSVSFTYRGRTTNLFPVRDIRYPQGFDISLQVTVADQYKTLKEVIVIKKTYRQDSVENRERYRKVFDFERGITINSGGMEGGVGVGIDPNSLINLFRFRYRKSMTSFQNRLLSEEAEKFVNHRFTKPLVKNLTGLEGEDLDHFMIVYRPSYEFTAMTTEYQFYQYILDASRLYRKGLMPGPDFWKGRF